MNGKYLGMLVKQICNIQKCREGYLGVQSEVRQNVVQGGILRHVHMFAGSDLQLHSLHVDTSVRLRID